MITTEQAKLIEAITGANIEEAEFVKETRVDGSWERKQKGKSRDASKREQRVNRRKAQQNRGGKSSRSSRR